MQIEDIKFLTPNAGSLHRVKRFWEKEPETVKWISTFSSNDIFYDVGANIGLYSMWAGKICQTYAFEPQIDNFCLLTQNIRENKFAERVFAYCCSLYDSHKLDLFYVRKAEAGISFSSFSEPVDDHLQPMDYPFVQGSISVTLDWLITQIPPPTVIKIDVDGFEHKVLQGGRKCIGGCRSVMIELDRVVPHHLEVITELETMGFHIVLEQGKGTGRTILFSK